MAERGYAEGNRSARAEVSFEAANKQIVWLIGAGHAVESGAAEGGYDEVLDTGHRSDFEDDVKDDVKDESDGDYEMAMMNTACPPTTVGTSMGKVS